MKTDTTLTVSERMDAAEKRVLRAARKFNACMGEFDGNLGACGVYMDELLDATDVLTAFELRLAQS